MIWIIFILGAFNAYLGNMLSERSEKITKKEFIVSSIIVWGIMLGGYGIWYGNKIMDVHYVNDEIVKIKYVPPYKYESKCSYPCDCVNGKCKICYRTCTKHEGNTYHYLRKTKEKSPLGYDLFFTKSDFDNMLDKFDGPYKIPGYRPPKTYDSDMNDYEYKLKENEIVPYAELKHYANKIAVSKNIILTNELKQDNVLDYPIDSSKFNVSLVVGNLDIDTEAIRKLNAKLKVANIVIYGFKDGLMSDCEAVKAKWKNGKVNDLVFCITSTDNATIDGIKVFGWTTNEVLKKDLETILMEQKFDIFSTLRESLANKINTEYELIDLNKYSYLTVYVSDSVKLYFLLSFIIIAAIAWLICYHNKYDDSNETHQKNTLQLENKQLK